MVVELLTVLLGVMSHMARSVTSATAWRLGGMFPSWPAPPAGCWPLGHILDTCSGAAQATSSTASHGATATAVGVTPAKAMTSRWRWDWST
jgi:hypothetical protein